MKKLISIILSLSLVNIGMPLYVFSRYNLAIPGNTEIGVSLAALLDQPISEVKLASLLGFADIDILKEHGFGMDDFRAAIKQGPIKDYILDKFFIPMDKGFYGIKPGITSKDFNSLLLKDYSKVAAFYGNKGGFFFENIFIEFLATHTYAGLSYIVEEIILGSFSLMIKGPYAHGSFPEFDLESADSPEDLLSKITDPNFYSMNIKVSDQTKEEVMQIFKSIPKDKQIIIACDGLRQSILYLEHIQEYKIKQREFMKTNSSVFEEQTQAITRIETAIKKIKNNIESFTLNLTSQENIEAENITVRLNRAADGSL